MQLSVVIPAYNEMRGIGSSLQRVWEYLEARCGAGDFEIIVVDDGSIDGTGALVEEFGTHAPEVKLIRLPHNRGAAGAREYTHPGLTFDYVPMAKRGFQGG